MTDNHEVSNVNVITFNAVPRLAVTTTSYNAATPVRGGPVNYVITPSVLAGANETVPITVTQTVPTGVVPVGAFGTDWICATPVGLAITCTTSGSTFTNGTTSARDQRGRDRDGRRRDIGDDPEFVDHHGVIDGRRNRDGHRDDHRRHGSSDCPTSVSINPTIGLIDRRWHRHDASDHQQHHAHRDRDRYRR